MQVPASVPTTAAGPRPEDHISAASTVAYAMLLNSHHQPFYEAKPQTISDCTAVFIGVLRDDLKLAASAK